MIKCDAENGHETGNELAMLGAISVVVPYEIQIVVLYEYNNFKRHRTITSLFLTEYKQGAGIEVQDGALILLWNSGVICFSIFNNLLTAGSG